jgi:amino acid adenylation domain-containing protein
MTSQLLQQLRDLGIGIYPEDGRLKTKSRKHAMTAELAHQISQQKDQCLTLLGQLFPSGLTTARVDAELAYYRDKWQGAPQRHQLPQRPTTDSTEPWQQLQQQVTAAVASQWQQAAAQLGLTLEQWLRAAYLVWLARWSYQDDLTLVVSTALPKTGLAATEPLAYQLLPWRGTVSTEHSFDTLAASFSAAVAELQQYQVLGFAALDQLLTPAELARPQSLCQLLFCYQTPAACWQQLSQLELVLAISHPLDCSTVQLSWQAQSHCVDLPLLQHFADSYLTLLDSLAQAPAQAVSSIPLLTSTASQQRLEQYAARQQFVVEEGIHQRVARFALLYPQQIAVRCGEQQLTYQQLMQQVNRLAYRLQAAGVQPDSLVGLCVERSVWSVVGILGILTAGAAYLPLDTAYPAERLSFMLQDSAAALVLTDSVHAQASFLAGIPQLEISQAIAQTDEAAQPSTALFQPTQLAYVIYTSGSTGQPKGVLIEHRHVMRLMAAAEQHFSFGPADRWSVFHSFSFDFSVWELWGALFYGGTALVVERHLAMDPAAFYQWVAEQQITVLNQTPSAFERFSRADATAAQALALRYIIFGGEALNLPSLQSWTDRHQDEQPALINMYGITETTVHVTYRRIRQADIRAGNGSLIGQPLADLSAYVLDPRQQPVPVGMVGELYVGGAGVARGYLNRPELTAQRFLPSPWQPAEVLYRTGDLVRSLDSGELVYVGRIDHQVKLRGFRIELGEIEALLAATAWVENACVIVHGELADEQRLVAYVTAASQPAVTAATLPGLLRQALQSQLPDFMLPSAFVLLPEFPLTVNGKVDKAKLPAPVFGAAQTDYVAAVTEQEQQLAAIWAQVLAVPQVGLTDNFFSLGGDSMRAIPLVAQMKAVGVNAGIRQLYQAPTIAELLQLTAQQDVIALPELAAFALLSAEQLAALARQFDLTQLQDAYPMTRLQQGMVAQNLLAQQQGTYHDLLGYHLHLPWDETCFRHALQALVARHDILRTVFSFGVDHALQVVRTELEPGLTVLDLRSLDTRAQEAWLDQWIDSEKTQSFALEQRLWQLFIHRRTDQSFQYTLDFHHALLDGWSVAALNSQLLHHYLALLQQQPAPAVPAALPYKYFSYLEQQALQEQFSRDWWQQQLADAQVPWWSGRAKHSTHRAVCLLQGETALQIRQLARQWQVTEKSVLLSTYLVLMALLSGKKDITTAVVVNARPEFAGSEHTLGLFLNSLPLRLNIRQQSWLQIVQAVHARAQDIQRVKHYPLAAVQQDAGLDFSASIFNYVELHQYEQLDPQLKVESGRAFDDKDYLFSLEIYKMPAGAESGYEVRFDVEQQIFPAEFLQRITGYYQRIVQSLVQGQPGVLRLADFIGAEERQLLLQHWNATAQQWPAASGITAYIEQQVARAPTAEAAVYQQQSLSYQQLNQQANQLAHWLRAQGIRPDMAVGLCMQRSLSLVVAILGILKAGAAYVPLEPGLPTDRLHYMINDAALSLIITQQAQLTVLADTVRTVALDSAAFAAELATYSPQDPVSTDNSPDQLAYIFYTSGSTGQPKGVMCTQRGLVNRMLWGQSFFQFSPTDRFLQKTPFMFDISICEFIAPLLCGGCIVLPEPDGHKDPHYLQQLMIAQQVTVAHFVPTMLSTFLATVDIAQCQQLRLVINGGEEMSKELNDRFFASGTQSAYYNLYGPTEAAIESSYWRCSADSTLAFVPIGKPIANTQLYVLNDDAELLPAGVEGELHIGGAGLARGYLNLAETSRQKFMQSPFAADGEARLYKTGDLARWLPEGQMQYLGRLDDQVKINGHRIELGEIKAKLLQLPQVKDVVVLAQREQASSRIVAYVVANDPAALSGPLAFIRQLKAELRQQLPLYMIPAQLQLLAALPLLNNGKVNKKALPPIRLQQDSYQLPTTATGLQLASLWQQLLDLPQPVSADANFFELGGQSLLAIRLLNEIRLAFGVLVPFTQLYEHQQLSALAAYIDLLQLSGLTTFTPQDALADNETEVLL